MPAPCVCVQTTHGAKYRSGIGGRNRRRTGHEGSVCSNPAIKQSHRCPALLVVCSLLPWHAILAPKNCTDTSARVEPLGVVGADRETIPDGIPYPSILSLTSHVPSPHGRNVQYEHEQDTDDEEIRSFHSLGSLCTARVHICRCIHWVEGLRAGLKSVSASVHYGDELPPLSE